MKKIVCIWMVLLFVSLLSLPVIAAPAELVITMQPQSPNYPEYSVAIYTVKATGTNLTATWYIQWQGKTYNASQIGGAMQPWEAYAGEAYGAKKLDSNTFAFIFEGIEKELDGAKIWCVLEDGHYDVTSQAAYIHVSGNVTPPEIVQMPASITVQQGEEAELRCVARSNSDAQLEFMWYETETGNLADIRAINRGTETCDFLICDTSTVGTRYYVCGVTSTAGGTTYSSVASVTVTAKSAASVAAPKIKTKSLPDAVVGTQYAVQLQCTDPEAEFFPYYNPGGKNDLEDGSWLGLSVDGWLMGTPTKAGTYGFSVCVMGAGGEDYAVYTLTVKEADRPITEATTQPAYPTESTPVTSETEPLLTTPETEIAPTAGESVQETLPAQQQQQNVSDYKAEIPWAVLLLIGFIAAGLGVCVAILLTNKK